MPALLTSIFIQAIATLTATNAVGEERLYQSTHIFPIVMKAAICAGG
jgi:hypothetical protein